MDIDQGNSRLEDKVPNFKSELQERSEIGPVPRILK